MDKRSALENLDLIFMTLDELVDGGCGPAPAQHRPCGVVLVPLQALPLRLLARLTTPLPSLRSIILETDPGVVAGRVSMRGGDGGDIPLSEQTFSQALASAKEQLARSLLS